jgi:hypothetical protein
MAPSNLLDMDVSFLAVFNISATHDIQQVRKGLGPNPLLLKISFTVWNAVVLVSLTFPVYPGEGNSDFIYKYLFQIPTYDMYTL